MRSETVAYIANELSEALTAMGGGVAVRHPIEDVALNGEADPRERRERRRQREPLVAMKADVYQVGITGS